MFKRHIIVLIALFALQACGNLPQPFRPLPDSSSALLTNPRGAGIGVLAPTGIKKDAATQIARKIATNLQNRDIPSELVEKVGTVGFTLEGNLREETSTVSNTSLIFDWRLLNRSGEINQRLGQTTVVNSEDWRDGDAQALGLIAKDISAQLISMFALPLDNQTLEQPVSRWEGITVSIQRPQNAPGDGAQALGRALANRLSSEGFKPAENRPDVVLGALVDVSPYDSTLEDVIVVWQVLTAEGDMLGDVRLDNRIPLGALDGAWGLAAEAIVEAALPGILEIIASRFDPAR